MAGAVGAGVGGWAFGAAGGAQAGLSSWVVGGAAGGAAAGATSGGLSAAVYGGSVSDGMIEGAGWGALAGAAFGALGWAYNGGWPWYRIPAQVATSAGLAALSGEDVLDASSFALATSISAWLFYSAQGENPKPEPGDNLIIKRDGDRSTQIDQNVGMAREPGNQSVGYTCEHHSIMRAIGKFPLMNAMATWHDNWLIEYHIPKPLWDYFLRYTPGHVIGLAGTFAAHSAATNPAYYGSFR